MSNARCLTEGVDVPAVDMVAFLSPKKSKVDIVQAIGRAMRKSGSKQVGYVLIPLYLEQKTGESLEEAVARANFEEVWDILQSLQEQDEVLAELIRDMAVAKGSGKGFDDSRFSDRIAFTGPVLALESIRQAVTTKVLDRLESSWAVNFGKLVKFKEKHGHCLVPAKYRKDIKLGRWVSLQRTEKKLNILPKNRESALDKIGFSWKADLHEKSWDERYEDLKEFKKEHGHCNVPLRDSNDSSLGTWVSNQRRLKKNRELSNERITLLNQIDFCWDTVDALWEMRFSEIKEFLYIHGHCNAPKLDKDFPNLHTWIGSQRTNKRRGILSSERIQRLNELGFLWKPNLEKWDSFFSKLVSFKKEHGHCDVRKSHEASLHQWVTSQRNAKKRGTLSIDRCEKLNSIGFIWALNDDLWSRRYAELEDFSKIHGHCNVPTRNGDLGKWVSHQRNRKKSGNITPEQETLLKSIGFNWGTNLPSWESRFSDLSKFKTEHGHCNVPRSCNEFPTLGSWIAVQRVKRRKGLLSESQIKALDELGFIWNAGKTKTEKSTKTWEESFAELIRFKEMHGHCNVPRSYTASDSLALWVSNQRAKKKRGVLLLEREKRLHSIGFEWKLR